MNKIIKTGHRPASVWFVKFVDKRVGGQGNCDALTTRAIPERFSNEVFSRRGAMSSVCTLIFTSLPARQLCCEHILFLAVFVCLSVCVYVCPSAQNLEN